MPWSTARLPDGPSLVRALAQALLDRTPASGGIVDLSDSLVLVPASRARRALERHLFALAAERGVAAIAPHVVTPGGLAGRLVVPRRRLVGSLAARASWSAALAGMPDAEVAPLFPDAAAGGGRSPLAEAAVARRAAAMHRDCSAAGIGFRDVAEHVRRTMPESDPARWDALCALSAARDRLLAACDAADPAAEAVAAADSGAIHAEGIRRAFVLLADPEPLQRRLLRALAASGADLTVFVHAAGPELPAPLDEEGFPDHAAWQRAAVEVPDGMIMLAGSPADQAAAVAEAIGGMPAPRRTTEIAIAVPDADAAREVSVRLPAWGIPVTAPPGRTAADAPVGLLVEALAAWIGERSCDALCALARHPDVERWLASRGCIDAVVRTAEFAAGGARAVPASLGHPACGRVRPVAEALDSLCAPMLRAAAPRAFGGALRDALGSLVRPMDQGARDAADAVRSAIDELESAPPALLAGLDAAALLRLVHERIAAETLPSEGPDDGVELMGWLEAGIDDAPHVVVAGMNDGTVPEGMVIDPWLPDSARERLGMPCARRRQARDAWILHGMVLRKPFLRLVCGRVTAEGEPLQPSRLLLGLRGEALARRVARMTDDATPRASAARWSAAMPARGLFGPEPVPEGTAAIATISVTAFRDWFASPKLFRLRRDPRLRLDEPRTSVHELDPMGFGNLVHAALERWGRGAAARTASGQPPETDPGAIERDLLAALDDLRAAEFVPELRGAFEVQLALAAERLRAFARVQADWAARGWSVLHSELAFGGGPGQLAPPEIGSSGIRLTGRIDRVDVHPELGHAALDYKTSAEAADPAAEHRTKDGEWKDLQLPLYRVLLRSTGLEVGPGHLGYCSLPSNPSRTEIRLAEGWDAAIVAEAEAEAERIAALVAAGDFSGADSWLPKDRDPFAAVWCAGMRGLRAEVAP
jgi:ATP-dependent helicase/nuclease subunit B